MFTIIKLYFFCPLNDHSRFSHCPCDNPVTNCASVLTISTRFASDYFLGLVLSTARVIDRMRLLRAHSYVLNTQINLAVCICLSFMPTLSVLEFCDKRTTRYRFSQLALRVRAMAVSSECQASFTRPAPYKNYHSVSEGELAGVLHHMEPNARLVIAAVYCPA